MLKIDVKTSPCAERLILGEEETGDSSCDLCTVAFPFVTTLKDVAAVGSVFLTPAPRTGPHYSLKQSLENFLLDVKERRH